MFKFNKLLQPDVLRILLEGPHPAVAGRLAGGFRAIGRGPVADEILGAMRGAGHVVNEVNPFEKPLPAVLPGGRPESPYVQRLRLMWAGLRWRSSLRRRSSRP